MNDKVQILCSPLGMYSLLRGEYIISVMNDDGTLNEKKLEEMVVKIANMGANGLRDFLWLDSAHAYQTLSPFIKDDNGQFKFNDLYFINQRTIATVCNNYGLRYYLSLFDHCGAKRGVGQSNPWHIFEDFFYGEDARRQRHEYICNLTAALSGLDVGLDICNEPKTGQGKFLADTFVYLINRKFNPRNIILGNDYFLKETNAAYGRDYREFRDTVADQLKAKAWKKAIKTECISPVHNATVETIDELWGADVKPGGERRVLYSMDGVRNPRPDRNTMYGIAKKVLEKKRNSREQDKIGFEVVFGKTEQDPLDSLEGVAQAYKDIFGVYPANYKKYNEGISPNREHENIVRHGYLALLGRDTDAGGLQSYVEYLCNGGTVLGFCERLVSSAEYRVNNAGRTPVELATRFYLAILDREPDEQGFEHTVEEIRKGAAALRVAAMLQSVEFMSKSQ
ncbi:MAG: DUF4214 domain-containing protein [bacterium]|nr:DUF4214 domain-containing protein [bacterium]